MRVGTKKAAGRRPWGKHRKRGRVRYEPPNELSQIMLEHPGTDNDNKALPLEILPSLTRRCGPCRSFGAVANDAHVS